MGAFKDVRGQKISDNLLVLDIKRENKRTWYLCKCSLCGSTKWIRADLAKNYKSCGCLSKTTQFKIDDLTGQRFGRLKVTNKHEARNTTTYWLCECECGKFKWIDAKSLKNGESQSCGCLSAELASERGKNLGENLFNSYKEKYLYDKTNIAVISNKNLISTNTSGVKGVCWDNNAQKWRAYITFQGKQYKLGRFENKEDAIKARQEAEEKFFKPTIEKYKKERE